MNEQHKFMNNKFFLYARKSTDVEDKQVRSIEDQITELRAFAKQNNLYVVVEFMEKQSAKIPGRPIFGEMLKELSMARQTEFWLGIPIDWCAILWTADK